jgi:pimeloyl-ACP methyl ester carboxylesterase
MKLAACALAVAACTFVPAAFADQLFTESAKEAQGPTGALKGTLTSPRSAPTAVVLIVPGSGPTDRDGNNPLGVKAATYKLLAQDLAAKGVATLRFDKRGLFASAPATKDPNAVTISDYVDDVRAWVAVLRTEAHAPCVWVLGHSEGGLIALASAKSVPDECGLVLVATPAKPMGEVLREQLKANPANEPLLGQALPAIDALEQGRHVDTKDMHPALQGLFNPAVQGFLISAFSYDPKRLIAGVEKPVLVIQGQRDLQVRPTDGPDLKQADPRAHLVMLPNVNHVLKTVAADDPQANMATYADPSLPLAPGVVDAIAGFLAENEPGAGH